MGNWDYFSMLIAGFWALLVRNSWFFRYAYIQMSQMFLEGVAWISSFFPIIPFSNEPLPVQKTKRSGWLCWRRAGLGPLERFWYFHIHFLWKSWEFHCYVRFTAGQEGWLDLGKLQDHCWVVMVREALKSKIHGVEEAVGSTTKETRKPLPGIAYMKLSRYPWLCHYVSQLFGDQQKTHLGLREFIHQHLANLGAFFFWDVGSFPHQAGSLTGSLIHPIPEMLGGAPRHRHLQVRKPGLLCLGGAESNGSEIRQSPVER